MIKVSNNRIMVTGNAYNVLNRNTVLWTGGFVVFEMTLIKGKIVPVFN
jgi:hypothetical protein